MSLAMRPIEYLVPVGLVPWIGALGTPGVTVPQGSALWGRGLMPFGPPGVAVPHRALTMGQGPCAPCPPGSSVPPQCRRGPPVPAVPLRHVPLLCAADNPSLLTIQPDLSTTTMTYQGSLCPRQDGPAKLQLPNGHLLSPLGAGRHTLHHSSPAAEGADFMARLSTQSYFRSLPRGTTNMAYGTFNFLGGRLMIPNTGTGGGHGVPEHRPVQGGPRGAQPPPAPPPTQGSACSSHPMPSHEGRSTRST